jgi:hypothetical protein
MAFLTVRATPAPDQPIRIKGESAIARMWGTRLEPASYDAPPCAIDFGFAFCQNENLAYCEE